MISVPSLYIHLPSQHFGRPRREGYQYLDRSVRILGRSPGGGSGAREKGGTKAAFFGKQSLPLLRQRNREVPGLTCTTYYVLYYTTKRCREGVRIEDGKKLLPWVINCFRSFFPFYSLKRTDTVVLLRSVVVGGITENISCCCCFYIFTQFRCRTRLKSANCLLSNARVTPPLQASIRWREEQPGEKEEM